ncbi:MAG: M23 family metallopeptidase [Thermoleophilia bacterium]|nr:M23 family metallopeptidase [Thermoleophilia bacterium]
MTTLCTLREGLVPLLSRPMRIALPLIITLVLATPAVAAAAQPPFTLFPVVGGAHYTDDFGDLRGSGTHQGNDLISPCGTPVVAVVPGTVRLDYGDRSGWMVTLTGKNSWYRYIHMGVKGDASSALAKGLNNDSTVKQGQVISYVGKTGDAASAPCHLHFELHYGTSVVSPFTWLQAATILQPDITDPAIMSASNSNVSLTITGTVVWMVSAGNGGRLFVRPSKIKASDGSAVKSIGIVVLRADLATLTTLQAGQKVVLVTAGAPLTSERLDLKPLTWSLATATLMG